MKSTSIRSVTQIVIIGLLLHAVCLIGYAKGDLCCSRCANCNGPGVSAPPCAGFNTCLDTGTQPCSVAIVQSFCDSACENQTQCGAPVGFLLDDCGAGPCDVAACLPYDLCKLTPAPAMSPVHLAIAVLVLTAMGWFGVRRRRDDEKRGM